MSPPVVHDYIRDLGRNWTGAGVAMEAGCWLGATSAALLEGLVEAGYDKTYWAFDRWVANMAEASKAQEQGVTIGVGQNLLPIFPDFFKKFSISSKSVSLFSSFVFRLFKIIYFSPNC